MQDIGRGCPVQLSFAVKLQKHVIVVSYKLVNTSQCEISHVRQQQFYKHIKSTLLMQISFADI